MVTVDNFNTMDDAMRAEMTWTGTHLGERYEDGQIIQLYSLPGFYVEVRYNTNSNEIMSFRGFAGVGELAPYFLL